MAMSSISTQVVQLMGSRASTGPSLLFVPRHLKCFSNQSGTITASGWQAGLPQGACMLWIGQGHLDEGPSEEETPAQAPLVKLCVLTQGQICFEGAPFS